jgi:hypothetical protein
MQALYLLRYLVPMSLRFLPFGSILSIAPLACCATALSTSNHHAVQEDTEAGVGPLHCLLPTIPRFGGPHDALLDSWRLDCATRGSNNDQRLYRSDTNLQDRLHHRLLCRQGDGCNHCGGMSVFVGGHHGTHCLEHVAQTRHGHATSSSMPLCAADDPSQLTCP